MIENPRSEEEKIIKDIRNLCRRKKELNDPAIKDIRNIFRLKKEIKEIKYIILRDIMNLFEHEAEEKYYKPVRVNNFWSNICLENKSNGDINKSWSISQ